MENKEGRQKSQGRHWYAIQTVPGYEKTVLKNLKQRIETLNVQDRIFDVIIPTKKVLKIKNGKKVEVEENILPGYVLVDMIVDDRSWLVVRNTPRVTGFLGTGVNPVPVSQTEMAGILDKMTEKEESVEIKDLEIGDLVKIKEGAFAGSKAKVIKINPEDNEVTVLLEFFGRETEVVLDIKEIVKV